MPKPLTAAELGAAQTLFIDQVLKSRNQPDVPSTDRPHTCHARGCATPVPPEMLMCKPHWAKVPPPIQRSVWRAYAPGQCNLDPPPSADWHLAADAAIAAVAIRDGLFTADQAVRWLERHGPVDARLVIIVRSAGGR